MRIMPERIRCFKETVSSFGVPRLFGPVTYWTPCIIKPNPADHISNRVPLDPEVD